MAPRVDLVRFTPIKGGPVEHQARNVTHIVKEKGEEVRTLCGARFHWSREMVSDHDHRSRMCAQCLRVKNKQDIGA